MPDIEEKAPAPGQSSSAPSDEELLSEFARTQSDDLFAELVKRHINWVFFAALRQVGNRANAEDATQTVFTALACKAQSLSRSAMG